MARVPNAAAAATGKAARVKKVKPVESKAAEPVAEKKGGRKRKLVNGEPSKPTVEEPAAKKAASKRRNNDAETETIADTKTALSRRKPAAGTKRAAAATATAATADVEKPPAAKHKPAAAKKSEEEVKPKLSFRGRGSVKGVVLTLGQGDTGQLGLGEDIMERSKPALVKDLEGVVDVCAGGMHSLCLNTKGEVYSFGCNDEGALGRDAEDDDCYAPGKVEIPGKVVQISAGDSHSVALTEDGRVYYWGTFRDGSGSIGLTTNGIEKLPIPLAHHLHVTKVASGSDHVALLTSSGELYTLGTAEQGQLGRIGERFVARGGRRGLGLLLTPERVHTRNRKIAFSDVWAGSYSTYALTTIGDVLVCGLNNYNQLGIEKGQLFFTLQHSESFTRVAQETGGWRDITPGQHHTICLAADGKAYAVGRVEYGRLGLGKSDGDQGDAKVPTAIGSDLEGGDVVHVACGSCVSFAVKADGSAYSWGMGTNGQLGHKNDDDAWEPESLVGKQLEERKVLAVVGGGQHTMVLAEPKDEK